MTSRPESDATTPLPDDESTSDGRTERAPGSDQPASEATMTGHHAASAMGNAVPPDGTPTAAVAPDTSADPEITLEQNVGLVLEEFAQTLVPEHQDLNQTFAQTSLKPACDSDSLNDFDGKQVPPSASVRTRNIRPAGQTTAGATGEPSTGPEAFQADLDYVTLNKLGEGGMGTVHLARQVSLGREVALKQIHQRSGGKESVRDEFLTEAVLTGKLEHPNIVPIYEVGTSSGGEMFYSMKNVKGRAWDETIDGLTLDENLKILIDVCDAVAFAHAEGVIHRDLKPQNIMTGGFGEVLVLDWGLAVLTPLRKDVKASAGGTPSYMAPEMINPPFLVGPRSDIYLLGAILFRFLTGTVPHAGKSAMSSLQAVFRNEIVTPDADRLQDLDPTGELLNVALKAMATAPTDRYQTVGEFQQAVRDFESHQESLKLAARAEEALQAAEQSDDYTRYSEAVFGFGQAVELWADNKSAAEGIERSCQAYALCAERKEDYELGLSLLDESNAEQREVIDRLSAARDERNARQGRLKRMKQGLIAAALLVLTVVTWAAFWINQERIEANTQRGIAVTEKKEADAQRKEAEKQRNIADQNQKQADAQRQIAEQNAAEALKQKGIAETETALAIASRKKTEATLARSNYFLAQARWESNRAAEARELLQKVPRQHRNFEWHLARRQFVGSDDTLYGHTHTVRSVSFSPDGTRIASGSFDRTIRLWDASTGEELHTLKGHTSSVRSVSFSPDGTRIASGGEDKTIRLWDATTGKEIKTLEGHEDSVRSVSFSPDGTRIASGGADRTIRLWDASTGEQLNTLKGHTAIVWSVSFSPDGTRIASGSADQTIRMWDAATGEQLNTLKGHDGWVTSVSFSPDGMRIASGSLDNTIRLWNALAGEQLNTLKGHTSYVTSVSFSPDGTRIASGSRDDTIRLWDASTGEQFDTLKGHASYVFSVSFSPDGTRIASGSIDQTIRLWEVSTGEDLNTLKGHTKPVRSVIFSPDGQRIASGSIDQTVRLWDASTGEQLNTLKGHTGPVYSVSFSPDGSRIASGSDDRTIRLWDASTGKQLYTFKGHRGPVTSVSFSPDGSRIASGCVDRTIRLWDAATGEQLYGLKGHADVIFSVSFSPDGTRIVSGSRDSTIRLWGEQINAIKGHTGFVFSVSFSPDGTRIASASGENGDPTIRLWDASTGEELNMLKGHTNYVNSASFSPDGTRIASASFDQTIRLWDASTGEEINTLKGHTGNVWSVSFSPDGKSIASGSTDGTICLWDASTDEEINTFKGHKRLVTSVGFNPDGTRLLSQDESGKQLIWDIKSGTVLPDGDVEEFPTGNDFRKSPDGRWLAVPSKTDVLLVDLAYRMTPRALQRRKLLTRPKPGWHSKRFQASQSSKQYYAAVFHAAWLLNITPSDASLHDVLQATHRQLLEAHHGESPPLPAIVREMLKRPRGSAPPAEANN